MDHAKCDEDAEQMDQETVFVMQTDRSEDG